MDLDTLNKTIVLGTKTWFYALWTMDRDKNNDANYMYMELISFEYNTSPMVWFGRIGMVLALLHFD